MSAPPSSVPVVQAPGKAMLIGEYAVLDGAPAVVAAVGCYARAQLAPAGTRPASPFIQAAMTHTERLLREAEIEPAAGTPVVDSAPFQEDGRKLGLGSSAAVTVAAVGALCQAAGLLAADPGSARLIYRAARLAHDEAQGVAGSGADVLAAALGGLRVLNDPLAERDVPAELRGEATSTSRSEAGALAAVPAQVVLVGTPQAASTPQLVQRYREAVHGGQAEAARQRLTQAAQRFLEAARGGVWADLQQAVDQAAQGYRELSQALGAELVTGSHAALIEVARTIGGVAKPSGAGGGDLAVVFLPLQATAEDDGRLRRSLEARLPAGCTLLPFTVGARGVHALTADGPIRPLEKTRS